MKKTMRVISAASVLLCVLFGVLYGFWRADVFYTLAISFGTTAYHFLMRLAVGYIFNITMKNKADYSRWWFRRRPWEMKLYNKLGVKRWKNKLPTFEPEVFDPDLHSWDEIAQAMCQSELVHEVIAVLSFVPVVFSIWFGAFWVFLITSILAAAFDLMFVIIQRYNRPRIIKMIKHRMKSHDLQRLPPAQP